MDTASSLIFPTSASDRLLHAWGYDLMEEYRQAAAALPHDMTRVVELATGSGRMCALLSTLFPSVITGDITDADRPRAIARIPDRFRDRVTFLTLDMEHLPFATGSIRALVCMNTLHEVQRPAVCLAEMVRVMHPDGTLVVGDFNARGFEVMQRIHEEVYHNDHDRGSISETEIDAFLQSRFRTIRIIRTPLNIIHSSSGPV